MLTLVAVEPARCDETTTRSDVVIYGGTSAAVIAGVQAKQMGKSVVIVSPDQHLGGLTSGGLGWTDTGNKSVIGGLAKDFYHRVYKHYQQPESWTAQTRQQYGNRAQGHRASDDDQATMWVFEPHVAEKIFEDLVAENDLKVIRDAWLDRENGVKTRDGRIVSITTLDGQTFAGSVFIDATYEGDLVAAANVDTTYGRESMSEYNEPLAGVQTGVLHHAHHFDVLSQRVDPYVVPGDPASGVIPLVSAEPPGAYGSGDKRVQAYCFRTCLTNFDPNRVPFPKPAGYDANEYEVLVRCFDAGWKNVFNKFDPIPNFKTDTNNHGPVSFDHIGMSYDYPEATYERRQEIIEEHRRYQQGLLYFIANDPRVPDDIQRRMQTWGLAKDEFTDNGNWPHQLYVREARRMIGEFVITQNHLQKRIPTPESVGMGSYAIDSHNVQRYITPEGYVQNEGDIGVSTNGPYEISRGCLLPKREQCENLVVPVCVSSTHMAFGSIRMEPVFMILGQSSATIAAMAIDGNKAVQDVGYAQLRERLLADGQILETPPGAGGHSVAKTVVHIQDVAGVTLDDVKAVLDGAWQMSRSSSVFCETGYRHDGNARESRATAEFAAELPESGWYEVRLGYPPNPNRSKRTAVQIHHADGVSNVVVDQTQPHGKGEAPFRLLGRYRFAKDDAAKVLVSNEGADGYVVIDAVNWRPVDGE
ncbi:FAD-dependent oxidoreductase [Rhodopirellula sp. ICT_H3.1]|uniref:FAD-dependent oxidoreductase n=2 Tax=Aporhodopirellula aestuarii TaxID=2950107 RepID=A0ABT0UBZ3_9BACT|nr:FAD-dependent oxidoreductase [Aporhodopirellula aestuarii]MCM2374539.1 FAD-dependent oxidoreductase [Aporhodopirellula aestuarii]